jgi:type VI secretion system Hcp family effector
MSKRWSVLVLSAGLALAGAAPALGAIDLALRVSPAAGDFAGESVRRGLEGTIELSAFDWGAAVPAAPGAGGGASGKTQFTALRVTKSVDRTSPAFLRAMAAGITIPSVRLTLRATTAGITTDFLEYCAERVTVSGYQVGGSAGGDRPTELIQLSFRRLALRYRPIGASGAPGPEVSGGWDLDANAAAPFTPSCGA